MLVGAHDSLSMSIRWQRSIQFTNHSPRAIARVHGRWYLRVETSKQTCMCGVFSCTSVLPNKPATTLPCKLGPPPLDVIVYSVTYVRTYLCFSHPVATYVDFAIHSNLSQLSFITRVSNFPSNVRTYVGGCTPTPALSMSSFSSVKEVGADCANNTNQTGSSSQGNFCR